MNLTEMCVPIVPLTTLLSEEHKRGEHAQAIIGCEDCLNPGSGITKISGF